MCFWSSGWRSTRPTCPRRTCARSASPTSARRQCSGIAAPELRCTMRSTGRTRGPIGCAGSSRVSSVSRCSRTRPGCRSAPTSRAPKIRWLLEHIPGLRERAEAGEVLFGTIDSWLIWNLCGRHVTDVTNASRTLMMDLETLDWDPSLLDAIGVPAAMLPEIRASSEAYGEAGAPIAGVPVASALGDQHAALVGQTCFEPGDAKCTFGDRELLRAQHRRPAGDVEQRLADHARIQARLGRAGVRARGPNRDHRRARAVVPGQHRVDRQRARD